MAGFSFGAPAAAAPAFGAPAAAAPAFGAPAAAAPAFGAPAAAAPAFGAPAAAAPAFGAPAAAAPAFGAPAAAAPAFGAPAAAAPAFGAPAAAAPAFGAPAVAAPAFGAPAAAAPAFGAPAAAAPAFGAPAAAAPAFGAPAAAASPSGLFGSQAPAAVHGGWPQGTAAQPLAPAAIPAAAPMSAVVSGHTPYASLPPQAKQALDAIYTKIMTHRRTMMQVQTMAPGLLRQNNQTQLSLSSPADVAAGLGAPDEGTLPAQLLSLQWKGQELHRTLETHRQEALALRQKYETSATQAVMYGVWPIEALAMRRGVKLKSSEEINKTNRVDPTVQDELKALLDKQAATVDRVEKIPSPYMWQVLHDLEYRLQDLQLGVTSLQSQLVHSQKALQEGLGASEDIASVVQMQTQAIFRVAETVASVHDHMEQLRLQYNRYESGENVLQKAETQETERQRRLEQQMRLQYLVAAPPSTASAALPIAAAPAGGGLFGAAPAAAPAGGGLFGAAPAAAPAGGGLFGAAPAAAPAGGGLFGAAPAAAPAGGGLFGAAPAAAPAGGGLFGAAPAVAPAGGGLFGNSAAPSPAATSAFSFGNNAVSTPKPKTKNRGGRRR